MLATARGYFDGSQIVLDSPAKFRRGQEVIVTYSVTQALPERDNVDALVDSLVGAVPDSGKTLEEYRAERLEKYADSGGCGS
ncbi:MAG: hypothetical protein J6Y13_05265 [Treponema sp.]|nr:hypothetical protein [Treponema sp.]